MLQKEDPQRYNMEVRQLLVTRGGSKLMIIRPATSVDRKEDLPKEFALYQNYPNPFNPVTNFQLTILKVYDVLGREVATLVDGELDAGEHSVVFDAKGLASGVYFYRMTTPTFSQTKSMTVIK